MNAAACIGSIALLEDRLATPPEEIFLVSMNGGAVDDEVLFASR